MCTIITGLFDIKRNTMDGRPWENYLNWFEKTLSINCPMVIFVEDQTIDFVKNKRGNLPTIVINQKIEDLEYFKYKEDMDRIISSKEYKDIIKDSNRIECQHSLYSIIQYSKFEFVEKSSIQNPFNSEYFIWMDAGLSRFFGDMDVNKEYPGKQFKSMIPAIKEKMLIQTFCSYYPDLFYSNLLSENYLTDNRSYVMGGMFCSGKEAIKNVKKEINLLFEEMLKNNIVNNEQIALGYLLKKKPELFVSFINDSNLHRSYELINQLQN
jgi:hypothetical protein